MKPKTGDDPAQLSFQPGKGSLNAAVTANQAIYYKLFFELLKTRKAKPIKPELIRLTNRRPNNADWKLVPVGIHQLLRQAFREGVRIWSSVQQPEHNTRKRSISYHIT